MKHVECWSAVTQPHSATELGATAQILGLRKPPKPASCNVSQEACPTLGMVVTPFGLDTTRPAPQMLRAGKPGLGACSVVVGMGA